MKENLPKYYTVPEAAEMLGKSQRQTWRYIREYEPEYALRAVMVGNTVIVLDSDLKDFQKRIKNRPDMRGQYDRENRNGKK